ncbi:MAG TPA: hypothetical protein VGI40_18820 [Pirellulaceae bacterium]
MFTALLADFLFRLTFGVAAAMAVTSSRQVTSGFFRVHLWALIGLQTLAALAVYSIDAPPKSPIAGIVIFQFAFAVAATLISYFGAVIWLYERPLAGKAALVAISGFCLAALAVGAPRTHFFFQVVDRASSGLLLGLVSTSMLLGHWYLNTPTMKLEPLRRLILMLAIAVLVRVAVSGSGAWLDVTHLANSSELPQSWTMFLALRWLSGLVGTLILAGLTWQTLKIPNTQSATGILYAAVILTFIGELTSQLLSAETLYPV